MDSKIYAKQEVIQLVREVFSKYQLMKSDFWNKEEYKKYNLPCINVIKRLFGNLDNMANECNIVFKKRDRAKYLLEHPEVKNKIISNSNIFQKGVKFDERYGKEQAIKIKEKISNSHKGLKPHNKGEKNINYYGLEKALQLRKRNKEHATKYTNEKLFNKVKQIIQKYGKISKCGLDKIRNEFNFPHKETIRYRFGSLNEFAKQANIIFCQPDIVFANQYNRKKVINEDVILDFIEQTNNIKLERHPVIFTKSSFCFPDAIDHVNKIIYEVDEKYHYWNRQQIKDEIREKEILEIYPDYIFIRLNEEELLNKIDMNLNTKICDY